MEGTVCTGARLPESAWLQAGSLRNRLAVCRQTRSSYIQVSILFTVFKVDPVIHSVHCPDGPTDTIPVIPPELAQSLLRHEFSYRLHQLHLQYEAYIHIAAIIIFMQSYIHQEIAARVSHI